METYIEIWWCCLDPVEQAAFAYGAASVGVGQTYMFAATFDALWLAAVGKSPLEREDIFKVSYGLTPGEISCGEDCFIDVYFLDMEYWTQIYIFSLTDAFICSEPCKERTFPN